MERQQREEKARQSDRSNGWGEGHSLLVVVVVCGAVLMAFEMVGSRILAPNFGNTVFVWGSLIGVFLGALSLGYLVGGRLADRTPSFFLLGTVIAAAGLIILIVPLYAPACSLWIGRAYPGHRINPLLASLGLFFVPSVLLGMVSPFAVRLQARSVATMGNVAGRLYALSTLGSIAGTLLATFWMIPSYGVSNLTKALGITLMALSLLAILPRLGRQWAAGRLGGTVATSAVALLAVGLALLHSPTFIPLNKDEYLIAEADSAYQHIGIVLLRPIPGTTQTQWSLRMMFDQYIESEVEVEPCKPDDPGSMPVRVLERGTEPYFLWPTEGDSNNEEEKKDEVPSHIRIREPYTSAAKYTDMLHLPFLFFPSSTPTSCLIVGGGGGVVPTIFRRDYPDMAIDIAEIDPVVVRLAEQFFAFKPNDERTSTSVVDGRIFLRDTTKRYDVIILDAFTGGRPPFHLMTREFLQLVQARLTPKGVVHLNIISALKGHRARFYRAVLKPFNDVFGADHVYVFPKRYDEGPTGRSDTDGTNVELIATNFDTVPNPLPRSELVRRAQQLVQSRRVTIESLTAHATYHRPDQRDRERKGELDAAPLLTDDYAPVDMMVID